ncbi:MAG: glucokinase [Pseudomonadota bacterium]
MSLDHAIVADLGATNARFALLDASGLSKVEILRVADYPSLASAISAYLDLVDPDRPPRLSAIAIASPVTGDYVEMTNHAWSFSIDELRDQLAFDRLEVINDFTAVAMAVPDLTPKDYITIGGGQVVPNTPVGVVGPGTGLGVSGLVPGRERWTPLAGEGGHVTMPAVTERESKVLDRLRQRFAHVSAERVLSGMGLVNLYETLAAIDGADPPSREPREVTEAALAGGDRHCVEAVSMFCAMLGTIAGNLALTLGCHGGIYIAGGIAPKMGPMFHRSEFRERFEAKGRFRDYLEAIPTYLITHPTPAFLGLRYVLEHPTKPTAPTLTP